MAKKTILLVLFLLVTPLSIGSVCGTNFVKKLLDNFHSVETGVFYRSAQLSPKHLIKYINRNKIKSVINLRGENTNCSWWLAEKKTIETLGVMFYNLKFCAKSMESQENIKNLLRIYQTAPRPILIHCKGGVDRTGEASALWVLEQQHKSRREALKQFSWRYGYFKFIAPTKYFLVKHWNESNCFSVKNIFG